MNTVSRRRRGDAGARSEAPRDGGVIVLTSANAWHEQRMADHQLARALSVFAPVLYVDPPAIRRPRVAGAEGPAGVRVLQPMRLPLLRNRWTAFLTRFLVAAQIRRQLRIVGVQRTLLIEANVTSPVVGILGEARSVYWAQDDWQGLAEIVGLNPRILERNERSLVRRSSAVVAANPLVADRLTRSRSDVRLIPFGASTSMFESESEDDARPTRRAVVMGTINARIDFTLLDAVVCAGVELLLVGPITDTDAGAAVDRLCERGDVEYRPQAPFRDMPEVLRGCAVGLVPYTHSLFNEGSFPLKTLEYLAAGLPVVATDLPAIRWLGCPDVDVADAPDAFAAAVRTLVDRPGPDLQGRERRRSFAREHDWERRAEAFVEVLALRDEVGARI